MNVLTIARGGRPKSINLERGLPWDGVRPHKGLPAEVVG